MTALCGVMARRAVASRDARRWLERWKFVYAHGCTVLKPSRYESSDHNGRSRPRSLHPVRRAPRRVAGVPLYSGTRWALYNQIILFSHRLRYHGKKLYIHILRTCTAATGICHPTHEYTIGSTENISETIMEMNGAPPSIDPQPLYPQRQLPPPFSHGGRPGPIRGGEPLPRSRGPRAGARGARRWRRRSSGRPCSRWRRAAWPERRGAAS